MKIKEWLADGGLFERIKALNPLMPIDGVKANKAFIFQYGERVVTDECVIHSPHDVAEILDFRFADKWGLLFDEVIEKYKMGGELVTETTDTTEVRNSIKDDVNKVSAFDSDELLVNDGANSSGKDDMTGKQVKTTHKENLDLELFFNNLSLREKNGIINVVFHDVVKSITLDIF